MHLRPFDLCHTPNSRPHVHVPHQSLHLSSKRSVGVDSLPPLSAGVSQAGGGPIAVAAAGQAVSFSNADDPDNDRGTTN